MLSHRSRHYALLLALCVAGRICAEPEVHPPTILRPEDTPAIEPDVPAENQTRPVANWLEV